MLPTIATPRLVLRPLAPGDAAPLRAYASDWHIARMLIGMPHPYPDGEAERFIASFVHEDPTETRRVFAVTRRGAFIGMLSLLSDGEPSDVALGYWIGRAHWGRGYATEALVALIEAYVFGALGIGRIEAGVFSDNPASARVLMKLGFRPFGEERRFSVARGVEVRHLLHELTPAAFAAARSA